MLHLRHFAGGSEISEEGNPIFTDGFLVPGIAATASYIDWRDSLCNFKFVDRF